MDGKARDEGRQGRIVALLVSLAGLAERAAGRCFPVRFLVFLLLSRAEAVARDHVEGVLEAAGLALEDPQILAHAPDSASLAIRFRLLAGILETVLAADLATPVSAGPDRIAGTWPAPPPFRAGRHGGRVGGDFPASSAAPFARTLHRGRPAGVTGNRPRSPPTAPTPAGRWARTARRATAAPSPCAGSFRGRTADPA